MEKRLRLKISIFKIKIYLNKNNLKIFDVENNLNEKLINPKKFF